MRNIAIRTRTEKEHNEAIEYIRNVLGECGRDDTDPFSYLYEYTLLEGGYFTQGFINEKFELLEIPSQKTFPRLMYVGDHPSDLNANQQNNPNLVLGMFNGFYLALSGYKSIEHIDHDSRTLFYKMAKEVPEEIEVSMEEAIKYISELKGWEVEQIKIV